MSAAKELFNKDKGHRDQLLAVTQADWFLKALAYAKAHMMEEFPLNGDMLSGMKLYESTLLNLHHTESQTDDPINSGLNHTPPELASRKPQPKQ